MILINGSLESRHFLYVVNERKVLHREQVHSKVPGWSLVWNELLSKELPRDSRDRSIKITDHFTYISASVTNWITRSCCKKLYIGETGRRLGDRFREQFRDVERNHKNVSKPVVRHLNLPNRSKRHKVVCGLSLHLGSSESHKNLEQTSLYQRVLFIQLIDSYFLVTIFAPIA